MRDMTMSRMEKTMFGTVLCVLMLCVTGCAESDTEKAQKRLCRAEEYAEKGQFNHARQEMDSIHILYPKAVSVRRQAKHLSDSLDYIEAVRTYHYSDSLRGVLLPQADILLKKFRYEKNASYEDRGKYVHRLLQTTGGNVSRCYLQCYIGDDRSTTLKSYYYGMRKIEQRELVLTCGEESVSREGSNYAFESEGWHEILSMDEESSLALLQFVSNHKGERVRVKIVGKSPYTYYLLENERIALDETYRLGALMHDIKQLEDAMRVADRTISKWEGSERVTEE